MDFLGQKFLGNTLLDYLAMLLIIVGGFILIAILKAYIISRREKKSKTELTPLDKLILKTMSKTFFVGIGILIIYGSLAHLDLGKSFETAMRAIAIITLIFVVARLLISLFNFGLLHYWAEKSGDESKVQSVRSIMPIIKILVYGLGVFFLLDNLGFKISTLIAGLGIGGVAVALAGQAILADLFSYFAILFDKPFQIGDFIIVDNHMGVVEKTGIKTTRIKSLSGEQLIFSNKDLTNARVRNYKVMSERRVTFKIGVVYQTPIEKLKEIPAIIQNAIEKADDTRFDRAHFGAYGDFSLIFETVYYVIGSDYNKYMDIQQRINLMIYEEFGNRNIGFAYPTQTLFVESHKS